MQKEIKYGKVPLSFVYEIKDKIPIRLLTYRPSMNIKVEEDAKECFLSFKEEIIEESVRKYHSFTEVI